MRFLFAVFEAGALVILQHAVLAAVVARAKGAVANDALSSVFAVLERAADLLRRHAAAERKGHVNGGIGRNGVVGEGGGWVGQVLAGMDEAQIGGLGHVGAQGEERTERAY